MHLAKPAPKSHLLIIAFNNCKQLLKNRVLRYKKNGLHLLYITVMCNIGQLIFLCSFSYFTCIYDDLMILIQQHI
jgi:hypothetical protein